MKLPNVVLAAIFVAVFWPSQLRAETLMVGGSGGGLELLRILGEKFVKQDPGTTIEVVPSLGSGGGIAAVNAGVLNLSVSWRKLNANEAKLPLIQMNFLNTPYTFVTTRAESISIQRNDITAIFSGAMSTWPDGQPLRLVLRPKSDANTYFLLTNVPGMEAAMDAARKRADIPTAATDQDNILVADKIDGVFAGMSLLQLKSSVGHRLKAVAIDNVEPSIETMRDGKYPFALTMLVVAKRDRAAVTERFLAYIGGPDAAAIVQQHGAIRQDMNVVP